MNNKRILVVDDSLTVLKALEIRLSGAGYSVTTAADGSEALEKAGRLHPNLVIIDVNFPPDVSQGGLAWDGFRLIEWLRHTGSAATAPAIIITSDDLDTHRDQAVAAGAVAMFQKPISMSELVDTVRDCFQEIPQPS